MSLKTTVTSLIERAIERQSDDNPVVILWKYSGDWEDALPSVNLMLEELDGDKKEMTFDAVDKSWQVIKFKVADDAGYVAVEPFTPPQKRIVGTTPKERAEYYKQWWRDNNPHMLDEAPELDTYVKPKIYGELA